MGWKYRDEEGESLASERVNLKSGVRKAAALLVAVLMVIVVVLLMTASPSAPARQGAIAVQEPAVAVGDIQKQVAASDTETQVVVETPKPLSPAPDNTAAPPAEEPVKAVAKDESPTQASIAADVEPVEVIVPKPKVKGLIVKGIIYSEDHPAAIVDDRIVHVGDIISGASIVGITRDSVVFEKQQARWSHMVQEAD